MARPAPDDDATILPFRGSLGHAQTAAAGRRLPKYARIANLILGRIERGEWRPGDRLPSETELARSMDASLGTIQKALKTLADDGVVMRHHGRGTFVGGSRAPDDDLRHFRFLSESGDAILPVFAHVLAIERIEETGPWAEFLGRQPFYLRLRRLLSVDKEFELLSEMHLPGPRFEALAALQPKALDGVLIRDFLAARFNAPTLEVEQRLTLGVLPPRACNVVKVARGSLGLIWVLMARSYRGQPISWQRVFVPPVDRALQILERPARADPDNGA